jgi:tRNA(Ile)-lysidine synthase
MAVPPDAIERFAAALAALWPEAARRPDLKLGLAVSGGPDSTALLLLAAAALPGRVEAASVDHRLRKAAGAECASVAVLCDAMGVPHATLAVDVAPGNLQAEARAARYAALAGWVEARGLGALATGHHADDQAETLIARLNRASGVAGLAGARARGQVPGTQIPLLRPLLGWRRDDLAAIVAGEGVLAVQDPSNRDDRFDRVRLRKALNGADWLDIGSIAQSATHLADADAAIDWAARREYAECVTTEGAGVVYRPQAPRAVALRVLARIVAELDCESARGGAIARLFDSLVAGSPASIGGLVARPIGGAWSITRAPKPRRKPG